MTSFGLRHELFYFPLEAGGDGGLRGFGREADGVADADLDLVGVEPAALFHLELAEAEESHGQDGNAALTGEQADAGPERNHFAFGRASALRENHHAVTAIESLAGVGEAGLEVALARQRKDVEE